MRWRRWLAVGLLPLVGFGECEPPDELGQGELEIAWVLRSGGATVDCLSAGAGLVRARTVEADTQNVRFEKEFFCDDGSGTMVYDELLPSHSLIIELIGFDGSTLDTSVVDSADVSLGRTVSAVFEVQGDDPEEEEGPCPREPGDPTRVTAVATVDGKVIALEPTCIEGKIFTDIGWEDVDYPAVIAWRDGAGLYLEINPFEGTHSCDSRTVALDMVGNGFVQFGSAQIADGQVVSHLGGRFEVSGYSTTSGGRVAGTFDCPVGAPDGAARGAVSGSFDVRLQ